MRHCPPGWPHGYPCAAVVHAEAEVVFRLPGSCGPRQYAVSSSALAVVPVHLHGWRFACGCLSALAKEQPSWRPRSELVTYLI